jgi:hypothetical protein
VPVWERREDAWLPVPLPSLGTFADPAVVLQLGMSVLSELPLGSASGDEVSAAGEALAAILGLADPGFADEPIAPPAPPPGLRPRPGWSEVQGRRITGPDGGLKPFVIVSCDRANRRFDEQAAENGASSIRLAVRLTNQPNVRPIKEFPSLEIGGRAACAQVVTVRAGRISDKIDTLPAALGVRDMRRIAEGVHASLEFS